MLVDGEEKVSTFVRYNYVDRAETRNRSAYVGLIDVAFAAIVRPPSALH